MKFLCRLDRKVLLVVNFFCYYFDADLCTFGLLQLVVEFRRALPFALELLCAATLFWMPFHVVCSLLFVLHWRGLV